MFTINYVEGRFVFPMLAISTIINDMWKEESPMKHFDTDEHFDTDDERWGGDALLNLHQTMIAVLCLIQCYRGDMKEIEH